MKEENDSKLTRIISPFCNPIDDLAEGLREEGYVPAGRLGIANPKQLDPNMVGILKDRDPVQGSFLGIKYNKMQKALHLGTILINSKEEGAIEDKKWILKINKSKYTSKLTEVVQKLAAPYNVEVEVKLSDNKPGRETYLHELY
jgi:hypothetical protein